ncbi:MAG: CRISPR-associated helicase Cas3' [Firmicutes bacterium]|nr:CRISPR-associated helicase Cas3' [Bacillota bacterium]
MVFYSHKQPVPKRMIEHINEVMKIAESQVDGIDKIKRDAVKILSICHDFGKYTTYFQKYLDTKKKSPFTNHGFISAVFGAYVAFNILGEESILPLIIFSAILHHHGNIENVSKDLPKTIKISPSAFSMSLHKKNEIAKKQLEDIKSNRDLIGKDFEFIDYRTIFEKFLNNSDIEKILSKLKQIEFKMSKQQSSEYYFLHNTLYSSLISADKMSASNTVISGEKYALFRSLDEIRIRKFKGQTSEISNIRQNVFNSVINNIEKNGKKYDIFSITSPTGTGKTFAGYFAALKLNELLGGKRKIIYALPFTSIIDQSYQSIHELYNNYNDYERENSRYLIKHHHLADVIYNTSETDYEKDQAELLLNNWVSGSIITTFVQLLETLVSNKNRMLMKLNSMKDAIVILDEVQAVDIEYYKLVDYVLKLAVKNLGLKIILMTATKPLVLTEAKELLDDALAYFNMFNRTRIVPRMEKITAEEFVDEYVPIICGKSCLIVCNTINQSLKVFELLKEKGINAEYLSSNILPVHRRKRIEEIKERLENKQKVVLVSTQVVEAGVDLDFDLVIRDIGPLDSIIQCAGRCNRNGKNNMGDVYVTQMVNENNELYSYKIYGSTSVNITIELLSKYDFIEEKEYYNLINEYFNRVQGNKSFEKSERIIESIESLNFDGDYGIPINKFSLIGNNQGYIDVIFRIDNYIEEAYQKFLEALKEKDYKTKRNLVLEVKNTIKDYTISLPVKYYRKFTRDEHYENIISLPYSDCVSLYNETTGFNRQEEDYYMF